MADTAEHFRQLFRETWDEFKLAEREPYPERIRYLRALWDVASMAEDSGAVPEADVARMVDFACKAMAIMTLAERAHRQPQQQQAQQQAEHDDEGARSSAAPVTYH